MLSYEEAIKDIEIMKKQIEILRKATKELKEDNDRWEQEQILKDLYHENP